MDIMGRNCIFVVLYSSFFICCLLPAHQNPRVRQDFGNVIENQANKNIN